MVAADFGFHLIPLPPLLWTPAAALLRVAAWCELVRTDPHPEAARAVAALLEEADDGRR